MLDWVLTLRLACSVAWQSHMQRSEPTGVVLQVFFIRDGAQFADLIHAAKPSPVNSLSPGWRFADFLSWHPESMNVVSLLQPIALSA